MNHSQIKRDVAALRALADRFKMSIPATIRAAIASALVTSAAATKAGDMSGAIAALESARNLLDSFVA